MVLNKVCELEDFRDPEAAAMIRWLEPDLVACNAAHPAGREHRKSWEQQQAIRGTIELGALRPESSVLIVNAGTERLMFALTHFARTVFAVDDYREASGPLSNPRAYAPFEFHPRRLRIEHANPWSLDFEDESFDAVFVLRFSGYPTYERASLVLLEAGRVLKRFGTAVLIADTAIDGGAPVAIPGSLIHSAGSIEHVVGLAPALTMVAGLQTTAGAETVAACRDWDSVVAETSAGRLEYPHVAFDYQGRRFTSAAVFLARP